MATVTGDVWFDVRLEYGGLSWYNTSSGFLLTHPWRSGILCSIWMAQATRLIRFDSSDAYRCRRSIQPQRPTENPIPWFPRYLPQAARHVSPTQEPL
jgi:hypothetical protein